jgi:tight adherence protein C
MVAIFILGFLFLATAIGLLIRAVTLPRARMSAHMHQIRTYGFNGGALERPQEVQSSFEAGLERLATRIGRVMQTQVPALKPLTRSQLVSGGVSNLSADTFHGYRVMVAIGLGIVIVLFALAAGSFSAITVALVVVSALVLWVLPASVLRRRGQARLDRVDRELPELVDVLTATIEAGLGFGGSLQLVADRFDGPMGDELRLTLHEQNMGLSTEHALGNLLERCETPSVRAFVRAVMQGEALGVSIGQMMRGLAAETRKRRRQAAHERVQKAPVKLLFPLVFLIFPALLIVLLYPAVSALLSQLGGGG